MADSDEDLITWIARQVRETSVEEGIAGRLREVLAEQSDDRPRHWRVTDLVNPAAAFHSRTHPEVSEDASIQGRLDYGSYVHGIAPAWFRQFPNYVSAEGPVDGVNGGFPNVRGKIDFRIGDTIIELKTTRHTLENAEDVVRLLPQSLEQLVLYILMTNRERFHHKLVYYHESPSGNFRVFNAVIKQPGPAKQFFKARLEALDFAVKSKNPMKLGRCRYLDIGCSFRMAGVCPCETLEPTNTLPLVNAVALTRDSETEAKLTDAEGKSSKHAEGSIGLWDLFTPRQFIARLLDPDADLGEFTDENYVRRRSQETALVFSELSAGRFDLVLTTGEEAQTPIRGRGLAVRLLQNKEGKPAEVEFPILVRVTNGNPPADPRELLDVYKAQLGALCAIRSSPTGLVNLTFSNRGGATQCYVLRFGNLHGIRTRLARRWILIQDAMRRKTVEGLVRCPNFVQRRCGSSCLCRDSSAD